MSLPYGPMHSWTVQISYADPTHGHRRHKRLGVVAASLEKVVERTKELGLPHMVVFNVAHRGAVDYAWFENEEYRFDGKRGE